MGRYNPKKKELIPLAKRFIETRLRLELPLQEMADRMQVSLRTLRLLENGNQKFANTLELKKLETVLAKVQTQVRMLTSDDLNRAAAPYRLQGYALDAAIEELFHGHKTDAAILLSRQEIEFTLSRWTGRSVAARYTLDDLFQSQARAQFYRANFYLVV